MLVSTQRDPDELDVEAIVDTLPDDEVVEDEDQDENPVPLPQPNGSPEKPRRRVRSGARPKVLARRELRLAVLADSSVRTPSDLADERPKTRGDCVDGPRPCPWVSCKYHLYLSVNPENGSIVINFPDHEPWEIKDSCALDVAGRGGITLEEVGEITNLTRERIRQVEVRGLIKLKACRGLPDPTE